MPSLRRRPSFRHSYVAVVSLGMPSILLVLKTVIGSLELDRTKMLCMRCSGGCEKRQRRVADPVEPVAPSRAHVCIFEW